MAKVLSRWVVYADGDCVGHRENETKANILAWDIAEHCANQDVPYFPKMTIVKEELRGDCEDEFK